MDKQNEYAEDSLDLLKKTGKVVHRWLGKQNFGTILLILLSMVLAGVGLFHLFTAGHKVVWGIWTFISVGFACVMLMDVHEHLEAEREKETESVERDLEYHAAENPPSAPHTLDNWGETPSPASASVTVPDSPAPRQEELLAEPEVYSDAVLHTRERMLRLRALYEDALISREEYEEKRKEILQEL